LGVGATGKARATAIGSWTTRQFNWKIEYSLEVMEEIRAAVCDGLRRLAHGGLEVGGVLFGLRTDTSIRLLAWRPIFCEHALGPSFRLSESDRSELARSLEAAARDPDLKGLDCLGWFVSHARSGIFLTPSDIEIYDSFFPEHWQVTLVLKPTDTGLTQAGFFVRENDGRLQSESSHEEFVIAPPTPPSAPERNSAPRDRSPANVSVEPARPRVAETTQLPNQTRPFQARPSVRDRWLWAVAVLLVLVVIGAAFTNKYAPSSDGSFPLRIYDAGNSVRIEWDSQSPLIRSARLAVLDIQDGKKTERIALTDEQLHAGKWSYERNSEDLELRMIVFPENQAGIQQYVRLVSPRTGPPIQPPRKEKTSPQSIPPAAVESNPRPIAQAASEDEVKHLKQELSKQSARAQQLQDVVRILQNRIAVEALRNSHPDRAAQPR
jgi:hypothetical protein